MATIENSASEFASTVHSTMGGDIVGGRASPAGNGAGNRSDSAPAGAGIGGVLSSSPSVFLGDELAKLMVK